ncbi:hypothetical protein [uncultured Lacinutrix sp.]|uniref:hypothetical protein n=1 Tax=uncultured Lacinutrix sp. TaxID=574032 RepID=UPI002623C463|nr:hypothetical protein [uncultured Lacinutrix sp.]
MLFLKRICKLLFKCSIIILVTLFLFEICYRYNVIDFYKIQSEGLNTKKELENNNVDLMVFGDSFSATSKAINYLDMLRESSNNFSIVNYSVPGFGIKQVNTFALKKIKKQKPKAILYQVYVGNDLIDVNHLWDLEKFSIARNLYWEASDHFLSLGYLNQRLSFLNVKKDFRLKGMVKNEFDANLYDIRTKRFLQYDASYLDNVLLLKGDFKKRYLSWLEHMQDFLDVIPKDVQVYLLWIPHAVQVNDYYYENMKTLGAIFGDQKIIQQNNYPFFYKAEKDLSSYKNVRHLNPLTFFQSKDTTNSRLYFANDPHINYDGNYALHAFLQNKIQ